MIYLDSHSTTPLLPEVWEAMRPYAMEQYGNPSSVHGVGRKARSALADAREQIAHVLNAHPDEVIFTSGATEANNLAVFGLAGATPTHIVASPIEHPCVSEPLKQLQARGFSVSDVPVNAQGMIEPIKFHGCVREVTKLAVVMLVNHEIGSIQPVRELAALVPRLAFHTDAAQAVGKFPVNFHDLNVSTLSFSAHKFGGPKGIGGLLVKRGRVLTPQMFGGHQQNNRRPGTESVMLAVGMATALKIATQRMETNRETVSRLRTLFQEQLVKLASPVVINSPADGSPYVLNVAFPGCRAELLLMMLDLAGVACSTGSACSSGSLLPSPVLQAMHVPDSVLQSAMRFSFAASLTEHQIISASEKIAASVARSREPASTTQTPGFS